MSVTKFIDELETVLDCKGQGYIKCLEKVKEMKEESFRDVFHRHIQKSNKIKEDNRKLKEENRKLKDEIEEMKEENNNLENMLGESYSKHDIADMEYEIEELVKKYNDVKEMNELHDELNRKKDQVIEEYKEKNQKLQMRISVNDYTNKEENKKLKQQNEELKEQNEKLKKQHEKFRITIINRNDELSKIVCPDCKYQDHKRIREGCLKLKEENEKLKEENEELKKQVEIADDDRDRAQDYKYVMKGFQNLQKTSKEERKEYVKEIETQRREIEELKEQMEDLYDEESVCDAEWFDDVVKGSSIYQELKKQYDELKLGVNVLENVLTETSK